MEKRSCVYPGSFDPITNGHMDIIARAAELFDEVTVAVLHNPAKVGRFSVEKRLELLRVVCAKWPNVCSASFDGLLVDYMRREKQHVVVRGLRDVADFESELRMAQLNRQLAPEVETLFLMTNPQQASISSSAVREIGLFGGDITPFVPTEIAAEVARILAPDGKE